MIPTVEFKEQYGQWIADIIKRFILGLIYEPVIGVVNSEAPKNIKLNAGNPAELRLMKKLQSGKILYDGAYFTGKFDSQSSKIIRELGGAWDNGRLAFKFPPGKLTDNLKVAVQASKDRIEKIHSGLNNVLGEIEKKIAPAVEQLDLTEGLTKVINGLQVQTINAMKAIGVPYTLTHGQREVISREYTDNMKLYIKGWAEEHIKTLRKEVQKNALQGYRFDQLKDMIEYRYGTSKAKAEFLARQETSLFMAKFRQQRFTQAGVNFYKWYTVGDHKVRPDHKELNGRIFKFGDPPIVDRSKGRRGEPGEDYNCRCIARAIVTPVELGGGEWREID
jgi:SPP1 gp7 family putative phage head morphogenesis protein